MFGSKWIVAALVFSATMAGTRLASAQNIPRIDDEPNNDMPILALDTGGPVPGAPKVETSEVEYAVSEAPASAEKAATTRSLQNAVHL